MYTRKQNEIKALATFYSYSFGIVCYGDFSQE